MDEQRRRFLNGISTIGCIVALVGVMILAGCLLLAFFSGGLGQVMVP